jgi:hypothetical protein
MPLLPIHICPTVAMYDKMYTVTNGTLGSIWPSRHAGKKSSYIQQRPANEQSEKLQSILNSIAIKIL